MKTTKILKSICAVVALFSSVELSPLVAQTASSDSIVAGKSVRGIAYASKAEAAAALARANDLPLFAGISVSTDVAGVIMAVATPYGQYEVAVRANLRGRYFPVVEMGWGVSDHTNDATDIHYKTAAPYFRIGCDYNVARNKSSFGRIFVGARYGFSSFKYDVDGPALVDPTYGTTQPIHIEGVKGAMHWGEVVFGLEAKVWGPLSLGWSVRYRLRFSNKTSEHGQPWYVPGFGKNGGSTLGGTFNVGFAI